MRKSSKYMSEWRYSIVLVFVWKVCTRFCFLYAVTASQMMYVKTENLHLQESQKGGWDVGWEEGRLHTLCCFIPFRFCTMFQILPLKKLTALKRVTEISRKTKIKTKKTPEKPKKNPKTQQQPRISAQVLDHQGLTMKRGQMTEFWARERT